MKKILASLLCLVMCFSSVSAFAQYEAPPTENILTKYLGFERVVGVVVGESDGKLDIVITKHDSVRPSREDKGERIICIVMHKKENNLLGYRIDAYVKNDGNKNIIIAGERENGRNFSVTLKAEMIKEFTNEKVVYSVDEKNIECEIQSYVEVKKDCFAVDCNIIVNGKLNPDFDVYKEYKDLGEITFLDNDKDGNFEFIIVNTEE